MSYENGLDASSALLAGVTLKVLSAMSILLVHVDTQVKINYWVDFGTFKVFLFLFLISF